MAFLWKHPQTRFWQVKYRRANGKYTNRSTRCENKKDAQKFCQRLEEATSDRYTEQKMRQVLLDVHEEHTGKRLESAKVADYFNQWLQLKARERAARTHEKYAGVTKQFLAFLEDRAGCDLNELTAADIARFRDSIFNRTTAPTANHHLKVVRSALQRAWKDGLIAENPALKVNTLSDRGESVERRHFSDEEVAGILKVASGEWRAMIGVALYTGMRLSDIASLTWSSIDYEKGSIRIVAAKTRQRLELPIAKALHRFLDELPHGDNPRGKLFPRAADRAASELSNEFHEILVSAGLVKERSHDKQGNGRAGRRNRSPISFHSFRHNTVSYMMMAGIAPAVIGDIVGHRSTAMSLAYTHINAKAKRQAIAAIPDFSHINPSHSGHKQRHLSKPRPRHAKK